MKVHPTHITPGRVLLSGKVVERASFKDGLVILVFTDETRSAYHADDTVDVFPESILGSSPLAAFGARYQQVVQQTKDEILADVRKAVVSPAVQDFSDLHNFVDANTYGGVCDDGFRESFGPGDEGNDAWITFCNAVSNEVDAWIKTDGVEEALGEDFAVLLREWDADAGDAEYRAALVFTIDVTALTPEQIGAVEAAVAAQLDDGTEDYPGVTYEHAVLDHDSDRDILSAVHVGLGH
jgi:hypothetical protein